MSRSKKLIVTVLFLIGACILLYPAVSNKLAEQNQADMISHYTEAIDDLSEKDLEAEWEKAVKYNESVTGAAVEDPFIVGSGSVLPDNYKEVLNVEEQEGVMGYLEIPVIDVKLPIYHGVSEKVIRKGAGHIDTTALPIGGAGTHSVLASHRGLSTAKLFTDLDKVKEGDLFYIYILDHKLTYEVDQILVVEPEDTSALRPIADKEYVTLLTCTPYGINSHRLLVRGEKRSDEIIKETEETKADTKKEKPSVTEIIAYGAAGFALLSLLAAAAFWIRKRLRKQKLKRADKRKTARRKMQTRRRKK